MIIQVIVEIVIKISSLNSITVHNNKENIFLLLDSKRDNDSLNV